MLTPPSQVSIVNVAAAALGSTERLTSIDDPGTLAKHARAHWDSVLRFILAEHPWNFALRRALLNEAGTAPDFGWARQFALPADCYRVLMPRHEDGTDYWTGEVEGGFVLTDAEAPLPLRYLSQDRVSEMGLWPPHFVRVMELGMAHALAEPLTGKQSVVDRMLDRADEALRRAKRVDGLESGNHLREEVIPRSRWLQGQMHPFQYYGR